MEENRQCVLGFLGVSSVWVARLRVCGSSLSLSQGTLGLWVLLLFSSPLFSVSPPSPESSSTPAPCSMYRAGVPKQLKATQVLHIVFFSLPQSSSIVSMTYLILNRNELFPKLLFVCTWFGFYFVLSAFCYCKCETPPVCVLLCLTALSDQSLNKKAPQTVTVSGRNFLFLWFIISSQYLLWTLGEY